MLYAWSRWWQTSPTEGKDGNRDDPNGEVVGAAPGALGHGAGPELHGRGVLVEHGRAVWVDAKRLISSWE